MKRVLAFLAALALPLPVWAASDWSIIYESPAEDVTTKLAYQFRTGAIATSEALDVSQCVGDFGFKWDPSTTDSSDVARGFLLSCQTTTQPIEECSRTAKLGSSSGTTGSEVWRLVGDYNTSPRNGAFLRARVTVSPTGGDVAAVEVTCSRLDSYAGVNGLVSRFDPINRTVIDFSLAAHTSCNNAACTPNDALTPYWIRQAIGAAAADTFAASVGYQTTGEGILDPGTAASTGIQMNLPAAQSLSLIEGNRLKFPYEQFYYRVAFWRTGTTAVMGVGLCGTVPASGAADPLITTAGALSASGEFIGVVWNAAGTMTSGFRGSAFGIQTKTTTETYTALTYHEVVIRPLVRNVGLDAVGGLDLGGSNPSAEGLVIEIDGVRHDIILDDAAGLPTLSTKQLSPCISAVNIGGTTDQANFADIDWFTQKQRSTPDDN